MEKPQYADRIEYGHKFIWLANGNHWKSTSGQDVRVYPPTEKNPDWMVKIPTQERAFPLRGDDVEKRAFCVAEGFTRQTAT